MELKEYMKTLNPNNSYWFMGSNCMERLNEVQFTEENLYIVFVCWVDWETDKPKKYHALPYTALKKAYNQYVICCPDGDEWDVENWIDKCNIPKELQEIFDRTEFETYDDPDPDDD